ncbi:MAG: transcription elongation factor GreA [Deltaproteobacteria bacterium]|jgi:transcription elongation factor GreA|nr:transcription elongation factor GreA [Deltaproteobacteria bacterium]MBT4527452.1 transcription elongation factor GreA [Deltaproteobacteria bacterium]
MDRQPITQEGFNDLQTELKDLIKNQRPKIIEDIAEARAHGDLKENAEYHAAKEKQGWIETRVQHINYLIANSEIIDVTTMKSDKIRFGATVTYENSETEEETTWKIVGEEEADFKQQKISIKSPIAKALLGKEEGDDVLIHVPKGKIEVEITDIKYI